MVSCAADSGECGTHAREGTHPSAKTYRQRAFARKDVAEEGGYNIEWCVAKASVRRRPTTTTGANLRVQSYRVCVADGKGAPDGPVRDVRSSRLSTLDLESLSLSRARSLHTQRALCRHPGVDG